MDLIKKWLEVAPDLVEDYRETLTFCKVERLNGAVVEVEVGNEDQTWFDILYAIFYPQEGRVEEISYDRFIKLILNPTGELEEN